MNEPTVKNTSDPSSKILAIVVPCYNEEEVLPETSKQLLSLLNHLMALGKISSQSCVYFVDDGSRDSTWALIEKLALAHDSVRGIKLAGNRGHQNALLAGLLSVKADVTVSIDADLQDDVSVIEQMIDEYHAGKEIVFGVRSKRESDSVFKRFTAEGYYRLLRLMGVDIVFNHADYRLMSDRACRVLADYGEINLFLRGIVVTIGLPSSVVTYERTERFAGESKYPLRKMLSFAFDGITSFSTVPLRLISTLGVLISIGSMALVLWVLWIKLIAGNAVPGWASSVLPIYLLGGVQLFCIGVVGEYIAKIYMESKRRPRFIIEKTTE